MGAKVEDFLVNGDWDRARLNSLLLEDICARIMSQVPPSVVPPHDQLFWNATPSGKFTIPSAIDSLIDDVSSSNVQEKDKRTSRKQSGHGKVPHEPRCVCG